MGRLMGERTESQVEEIEDGMEEVFSRAVRRVFCCNQMNILFLVHTLSGTHFIALG